jgi:hypothetical protein
MFTERIKTGILSKTKTSIPEYIFMGKITNGIPLKITYIRQDKPSEKAIGNRRIRQMINTKMSKAIMCFFFEAE